VNTNSAQERIDIFKIKEVFMGMSKLLLFSVSKTKTQDIFQIYEAKHQETLFICRAVDILLHAYVLFSGAEPHHFDPALDPGRENYATPVTTPFPIWLILYTNCILVI
jgi:hypothetical protein